MARKPTRARPAKKSAKGMRAVASSSARPVEEEDGAPAIDSGGARAGSRPVRPYQHRKGAPTARLAVAPGPVISRDQEYAFIREDMRRLLVTAGILIVVMIGLLLVIGQ